MLALPDKDKYLIGLISDTHGLLRSGVSSVFKDTDLIIHTGDIGKPSILESLRNIAPVVAVRGNMDYGGWADKIPSTDIIEVGQTLIYMLHDLYELDLEPSGIGVRAVIYGHTHRPNIEEKNGVLFVNPGSAGPRRFDYPISVALLRIHGDSVNARIIDIKG